MATAPRSSASESLASSTNSTAPSSSSARTASSQSQSVASARPSVKATKEIASSSAVSPILPSSSSSLVSSEPASSTANVSASSRHRAPSPATPSSSTNVLNGGIQVNSANVSATSTPSSNATGSSTLEVSTSLSSSAASSARAISTSLPSSSSSHALSPSNINSASSPGSSPQANQSNIANAPVSTIFSTATDTPESTFSSPVSITLTGQNGLKSVSVPAVITSVTPSTSSDGTVVQITHIIANPNGNLNALQHHSFFDNHGAVAGTFIAAGLVAAASLGVAFCMLRRRRRRERRRRLEAMLPSMPSNPFEDGQDGRQAMSQRSSAYHDFGVYDEPSPALRHPEQARINGNIESSGRGGNNMYEGPFSDYHSPGRDSFFDQDRVIDVRPASRQLSTPSIYPPSLPDSDEDSLYAKEVSPPLPLSQTAPVSEYTPLERVGIRPSTQESQLSTLNKEHPPLAPDMTMTRSLSVTSHTDSSSYGHSTIGGPSTPTSENTTIAASEEGIKGHPMLPSPPSAFLRRQLSKRTPMTIIVSQSSVTSPPQTADSSIGYGTAM